MGRRPIPVCGFGHVILYDETSTMRTYLYTMRDHPNMSFKQQFSGKEQKN